MPSRNNELVIDIETAPVVRWQDLPPEQQHYLLERPRPFERGETADERLNLTPLYGKVVAIGTWLIADNRGCCLWEKPEEEGWVEKPEIADTCFLGGEAALLDAFWKVVAKYPGRIVTWNGRAFDIPFLYLRSAVHGIRPSRNIMGTRYSLNVHCDLFEVVTFFGATRVGGYSLESYCHAFDLTNPKSELQGSDIAGIYEEGKIEEIASYCMGDVLATKELYKRLQDVIRVLG
jgi:3'-5' exonuclease